MTETRFDSTHCDRVIENMDAYLDRELSESDRTCLLAHVGECADCARVMNDRSKLRSRLKAAVNDAPVPFGLETRIRQTLESGERRSRPSFFMRFAIPVAVMLAVGVGLAITYQLGHLRLTVASQEAYIRSISTRVPDLMRVGLGDHVHCTVFRKYSKTPPTFPEMARDLGPDYKALLPVVSEHIGSDYRVIMGHRCSYHRQKFVHLAMRSASNLVSLVIARRGEGEAFDKSELASILVDGIPMYRAAVQRFSIAALETGNYLVYVVSDLGQDDNAKMLAAITPSIRAVLNHEGA